MQILLEMWELTGKGLNNTIVYLLYQIIITLVTYVVLPTIVWKLLTNRSKEKDEQI